EGVYQSARDGRLLSVNPAFVSILGYDNAAELYALPNVAMLYWDPADRAEFVRQVESEGEIRNAEFRMRRRDGQQVVILENARAMRDAKNRIVGYEGTIANITERKRAEQAVFAEKERAQVTIQESAAPIWHRKGRVIGAVIVFHDVTKERRLKRALSYQASHDALTGLINRREFDNLLHTAVLGAQCGEGSYALLYIDLDQFKVVNDTCGHQAGDRLLRDVTGLLQTRVRVSDTIARLGGDDFG